MKWGPGSAAQHSKALHCCRPPAPTSTSEGLPADARPPPPDQPHDTALPTACPPTCRSHVDRLPAPAALTGAGAGTRGLCRHPAAAHGRRLLQPSTSVCRWADRQRARGRGAGFPAQGRGGRCSAVRCSAQSAASQPHLVLLLGQLALTWLWLPRPHLRPPFTPGHLRPHPPCRCPADMGAVPRGAPARQPRGGGLPAAGAHG